MDNKNIMKMEFCKPKYHYYDENENMFTIICDCYESDKITFLKHLSELTDEDYKSIFDYPEIILQINKFFYNFLKKSNNQVYHILHNTNYLNVLFKCLEHRVVNYNELLFRELFGKNMHQLRKTGTRVKQMYLSVLIQWVSNVSSFRKIAMENDVFTYLNS